MATTPAPKKTWKVVGATAAVATLGLGGIWGLSASADDSKPELIDLQDTRTTVSVTAPDALVGEPAEVRLGGDTDSLSSPLDRDSTASRASTASPASPVSPASPQPSPASPLSPASVASPASVDTPAPKAAPAPAPKTSPAPAPAPRPQASPASPASAQSVDSPD